MTEGTNIKIYRATHQELQKIRAQLMLEREKEVSLADAVAWAVEKALREKEKK